MHTSTPMVVIQALLEQIANNAEITSPIVLNKPSQGTFGDLSTNFAMLSHRQVAAQYQTPREWAEAIRQQLLELDTNHVLSDIQVAGPGFINFTFGDAHLLVTMRQILANGRATLTDLGQQRKAIVEYSSPNIAKPFTVGHLRSTIIGDSVANLLEASGYQVFRDNHLGDWGTQFGKQIVAIKRFGDENLIDQSTEPVKELVALYVKFHEEAEKNPQLEDEARTWFSKLENGDAEARRLWQKCIDWSFVEFAKIYNYLGVQFTENNGRGFGESFFESHLQDLIVDLQKLGFAKPGKEGAILFFCPNDEFSPLMIAKKDGSTLYATRDLATDNWRRQNPRYQNADGSAPLVVNEVGSEQTFYFRQLYRAEELLAWYRKGQRVHVGHGLYRFKEGKMSTRKGNVIWLQDVLSKAKDKALDFTTDPKVAKTVSIAALKWNDLRRKSELNINFDWNEILNLQGNSGPYMLYTYARAKSVLRKATELVGKQIDKQVEPATNLQNLEKELLSKLEDFAEVVVRSASEFSPHILCNYLYELAQTFNSFYNKYPILNAEKERTLRLQIVQAVAIVLGQGLGLLGIVTLEKM